MFKYGKSVKNYMNHQLYELIAYIYIYVTKKCVFM